VKDILVPRQFNGLQDDLWHPVYQPFYILRHNASLCWEQIK
jgi:hypothetical protein